MTRVEVGLINCAQLRLFTLLYATDGVSVESGTTLQPFPRNCHLLRVVFTGPEIVEQVNDDSCVDHDIIQQLAETV